MIESSVVLPLPDGPIISSTSPPWTSSETSTSARTAVAPVAVGLADARRRRWQVVMVIIP